jgi:hypothetical protein
MIFPICSGTISENVPQTCYLAIQREQRVPLIGRGMGISPDGKTLAYLVEVLTSERQNGVEKIALLDLATLHSPHLMDVNPRISSGAQFTPDGKAVAY